MWRTLENAAELLNYRPSHVSMIAALDSCPSPKEIQCFSLI
jgi:hypothetical protein